LIWRLIGDEQGGGTGDDGGEGGGGEGRAALPTGCLLLFILQSLSGQ